MAVGNLSAEGMTSIEQFKTMGLETGGESGNWLQPVPMVELTPEA